jgi:glycine cleavage system H protein
MLAEKNAVQEDRLYTQSHEWIRKENDNTITIGISAHAQEQLGDIVFADLPSTGTELAAGEDAAVLESVKTAADIYAPIDGKIIAINEELSSTPELINQDPFHAGWLFKMTIANAEQLDALLSPADYQMQIDSE